MNIVIRENVEEYMNDLKKWISDTDALDLEEMDMFFIKRIGGYEEHMMTWKKAYRRFAQLLPQECKHILDLGCGTGLELDEIWRVNPDVSVVGVDLCQSMLDKLLEKHYGKRLEVVCKDYFQYDIGNEKWDAVISFESLHHFEPEIKYTLYKRIYDGLKIGGEFILGDYIACCDEEEELLRNVCREKRERFGVNPNSFIHFDTPLTLEHELQLLYKSGFSATSFVESIDGATIMVVKK